VIRSLKRFTELNRVEQSLVLQAAPLLLHSVLALKVFGFNRVYGRHNHSNPPAAHPLPAGGLETYARAVRRASKGLGIGTCLSRSIALRQLLRRKGIDSEFRIGVDKKDGEFSAHAWLEYDGHPIGENITADYKVFAELR
jgi:hypothetical protein